MSKYTEMSDFEINKLVAESFGLKVLFTNSGLGRVYLDNEDQSKFDPCNNPSDAWPIILEYKIGIDTSGIKGDEDRLWWAELTFDVYGDNHYAEDKNPLRAAMIVYLMMGDES